MVICPTCKAEFEITSAVRLLAKWLIDILPNRIANLLESHGVYTVNDVLQWTPDDLLALPNFGPVALEHLYYGLERIGFYRKGQIPNSIEAQTQRELENINVLKVSEIVVKALVIPGDRTKEGTLIKSIAIPWLKIVEVIANDPVAIYQISWRKWEEIIAGAYSASGYEVVLTPPSNDQGRDVIATKRGIGCIRILDQVKAYNPHHLVTADEVRSMIGVITGYPNVSKGIITTTSMFAPGVEEAENIKPFIPFRLELRPKDATIAWLTSLVSGGRLLE